MLQHNKATAGRKRADRHEILADTRWKGDTAATQNVIEGCERPGQIKGNRRKPYRGRRRVIYLE